MTSPDFHFALREDLEPICIASNLQSGGKLLPSDFAPHRADPEATGYDVRCAIDGGITLKPGCYVKIPLGFRMYAPKGWWLNLAPRSSTFIKRHIHALYGIIDETYENEMMFVGQYLPDACELLSPGKDQFIAFGERIAQVVPIERKDMAIHIATSAEIDKMYAERSAVRGTGGFGSTNKF